MAGNYETNLSCPLNLLLDNPNIGGTGSETGGGSALSGLSGYSRRLLKNLTALRTSDTSLCDVELVPGLSNQVSISPATFYGDNLKKLDHFDLLSKRSSL